jgi:acyl-coenzyme A thioesterase PaaI-like protein
MAGRCPMMVTQGKVKCAMPIHPRHVGVRRNNAVSHTIIHGGIVTTKGNYAESTMR